MLDAILTEYMGLYNLMSWILAMTVTVGLPQVRCHLFIQLGYCRCTSRAEDDKVKEKTIAEQTCLQHFNNPRLYNPPEEPSPGFLCQAATIYPFVIGGT